MIGNCWGVNGFNDEKKRCSCGLRDLGKASIEGCLKLGTRFCYFCRDLHWVVCELMFWGMIGRGATVCLRWRPRSGYARLSSCVGRLGV